MTTLSMIKMATQKLLSQFHYDYESYQPCFYGSETEEELYKAPLTSEDIWKKFELLPTPPRSPRREGTDSPPFDPVGLDEVSEKLNFDLVDYINNRPTIDLHHTMKPPDFPESPPTPSALKSKLIQDCMWSGKTGRLGEKLTPADSESNSNGVVFDPTATCVDPASVFPFPISASRHHNLGTETPSDSEEEIDVVTVEKLQSRTPTVISLKRKCVDDNSCDDSDADSEDSFLNSSTLLKNVKVHSISQPSPQPTRTVNSEPKSVTLVIHRTKVDTPTDVHNYSLPRSHSFKRTKSHGHHSGHSTPSKKMKRELSLPELKSVVQKLKSNSGSRNSSDSEEGGEGKRAQHNVLERKRRNDLKYSFYTLRDQVPDLLGQDKAAKVAILRKASEFIHRLTAKEKTLLRELEVQQARNNRLRCLLGEIEF